MSKFDEALARYREEMAEMGIKNVDDALLRAVTKGLGPSIYLADASKVGCSDKDELARVKKNFLVRKLGLIDSPALDRAIDDVCEECGRSNPNKYRAIFYYLLTKKFNRNSIYGL